MPLPPPLNSTMIDVHVIPVEGFDLTKLVRSLEHPLISVHVAEFVPGNILQARANGFRLGVQPYVSWVDGDDEILDVGWVDQAILALQDPKIVAAYPRWKASHYHGMEHESEFVPWSRANHWKPDGPAPRAHWLTVMRRGPVQELMQTALRDLGSLVTGTEHFLMSGLARYGRFHAIDALAYHWKIRPQSGISHSNTEAAREYLIRRRFEDAGLTGATSPSALQRQ
jgi:hypothetical protein